MARKTKAYVDTSALIAFLDLSDTYHPLFARLFSDPPPLVTTPLVVSEGHAWFVKRYDSMKALQFLSFVQELTPLAIQPVGGKETVAATEFIRKYSDQALTLVDAVGLYFMDRLRIESCWSTDRHLGITGKRLVIHGVS